MTIKELYEYAKVNGFENLPFRYGYVDDDGVYRPMILILQILNTMQKK